MREYKIAFFVDHNAYFVLLKRLSIMSLLMRGLQDLIPFVDACFWQVLAGKYDWQSSE